MMEPVLTAAESARLDSESSTPVEVLMDRAGRHLATAAADMGVGYGSHVVVLAGPGNNGGDGYVAARYLHRRGVDVNVRALTNPRTDASKQAKGDAVAAGVTVTVLGAPERSDLIIDAMFGGGSRRGIPDALVPWMGAGGAILAVDMPTGLDTDTGVAEQHTFRATRTVTFHSLKPGHLLGDGPDHVGEVKVVDIGLTGGDPIYQLTTEADAPLPTRVRRDHKWSVGSVLVVGGSAGMTGAAVLAARSALHFGAGAVGVVSPERETVAATGPELLTYSTSDLEAQLERYDVVVVGPGLDPGSDMITTVLAAGAKVVADAGVLHPSNDLRSRGAELVLTPHAGEFSRLTGQSAGPDAALDLAAQLKATVVLKGAPTIVAYRSGVPAIVTSGGPELATIGTGDVLAGMIGAVWARGLPDHVAARSAAFWHGVAAADLARTETVTADVLARHVGRFAR